MTWYCRPTYQQGQCTTRTSQGSAPAWATGPFPGTAGSCGTRGLLPLRQGPPNEQAWLIPAHGASAAHHPAPRAASSPPGGPAHRPLPKPSATSSRASPHDPRSPKSTASAARLPRALPSPASHGTSTGPGPAAGPAPALGSRPASLRRAEPRAGGRSPPPCAPEPPESARGDAGGSKRAGPVGRTLTAPARRAEAAAGPGWGREAADGSRDPAIPPTHRRSKMAEKEEAGRPRGIMGGPWARGGARRPAGSRETRRPSREAPRARPAIPIGREAPIALPERRFCPGCYSDQNASQRAGVRPGGRAKKRAAPALSGTRSPQPAGGSSLPSAAPAGTAPRQNEASDGGLSAGRGGGQPNRTDPKPPAKQTVPWLQFCSFSLLVLGLFWVFFPHKTEHNRGIPSIFDFHWSFNGAAYTGERHSYSLLRGVSPGSWRPEVSKAAPSGWVVFLPNFNLKREHGSPYCNSERTAL